MDEMPQTEHWLTCIHPFLSSDLFPQTTIMFGDISGFTAWSSAREPSQVFVLLETIYAEFDRIAKRRRVFKVEVVGDCYVVSSTEWTCSELVLRLEIRSHQY